MRTSLGNCLLVIITLGLCFLPSLAEPSLAGAASPAFHKKFTSLDGLRAHNSRVEAVSFKGRKSVRVTEADATSSRGESIVILTGSDFGDGIIEAVLAAQPAAGAPEGSRGFVGIAFRVAPDVSRFECLYLRPTNGRADDQLRRNHSTQYISFPDFPWFKLRQEFPGKYESYVDLQPGEWTRVKIEVRGTKAQLFVNGAGQPCLIVSDLKLGETRGAIALWIGQGTEAWFSEVNVAP